MTSRISVDPFTIGESRLIAFDFASQMIAGQTISGTPVAASSVYSGTDVTPDIVNSVSVSGTIANVSLGGAKAGTLGVIYDVLVTATLATPTEIKTMAAYIAFIPTLPAAVA